jgi:hypothetical protein
MVGTEERELGYLFKLKQSANVKKLIGQIFRKEDWVDRPEPFPDSVSPWL